MRTALTRLACGIPLLAPLAASAQSSAIIPADLRARVEILADDSMGGRRTGTPGLERASAYVAAELARLGLRPASAGGYRVPVELERTVSRVQATVAGRTLGPDVLLLMSGTAGLPAAVQASGRGRIVYGGLNPDSSGHEEDRLTTERLTGSVLMLQAGTAEEGSMRHPVVSLAGAGSPIRALLLVITDSAEWALLRADARNGTIGARPVVDGLPPGPPVFAIRGAEAERILGRPLREALRTQVDLGEFSYQVEQVRTPVQAANLVAILPGTDSSSSREYVVLGAHLDHVGVGEPVRGDSIYNGADDDASGSAALLEVAERLSALPFTERPRRSVLFIWHTAEEEGLLGSRAFATRPVVPRQQLVAMLNLDMVARNHPDSLHVIGSRRLSTALGDALERANAALPRPFALDYTLDQPGHPERLYCRSDHHSYARFGIPVAYLTGGLHPDYHLPDDEATRLDYAKLARVSELVARLALDLAALSQGPRVDHALPPLGVPCS